MEKSCKKWSPKAIPRPLFKFGEKPKPDPACQKFLLRQVNKARIPSYLKQKIFKFFMRNNQICTYFSVGVTR